LTSCELDLLFDDETSHTPQSKKNWQSGQGPRNFITLPYRSFCLSMPKVYLSILCSLSRPTFRKCPVILVFGFSVDLPFRWQRGQLRCLHPFHPIDVRSRVPVLFEMPTEEKQNDKQDNTNERANDTAHDDCSSVVRHRNGHTCLTIMRGFISRRAHTRNWISMGTTHH
jgi:hypothetical protein